MNRALLLCVLGLAVVGAASAEPQISGSTRYQFGPGNATVTLGIDAITNSSDEITTGTIKVQLWALAGPYHASHGRLQGHLLGGFTLDPLLAGNLYDGVSRSVNVTLPARRANYVLAMVVSEYRGNGYVIADFRNFDNPVLLSPPQLFTMRGPWYWQASPSDGTLTMQVAHIRHTRSGKTGSLRLSLWATPTPFAGGSVRGFELGRVEKKALTQGYVYNDLDNTVELWAPPPGDYYVSLLLSEFDGERYVLRAYLTSDDVSTFE